MKKTQRCSLLLVLAVFPVSMSWSQEKAVTGGYVTNEGVSIWYRVEGTDAAGSVPLLMLHGGPGATARPFEKTIGPELAKNRRVVYMDYRGAGRSGRPQDPSQYSFQILASDADAVRKHLGIEQWAVFGHSNGGATAISYALKYPKHVTALLLCDPLLSPADLEMNMIHKVALAPPDKYDQARAVYKSNLDADARFGQLLDLIDLKTRYTFQYFDPKNSDVLDHIQAELAAEIGKPLMDPVLIQGLIANGFFQFDAFKSAGSLTMPLLIVLGRYDSEISLDNSLKFAVTVPDGYVTLLDHSGHHPYLEETLATAGRINSFLAQHVDPKIGSGR
jgi:proline iminopeptidase